MPKPLVPILGKPVISHIFDLLAENQFTNAVVATAYMAEQIESLNHESLSLNFVREKEPLGTAGCVKNAENLLPETFLVISGDAVCDFDLKKAMEIHIKSGCNASMLLAGSKSPLEYGVVLTKNGFVTGFNEKPPLSQALSDKINSGIYILNKNVLDYVNNFPCDFARDVFPAMLNSGDKICAIDCGGYWCDIGDLQSYYNCNIDALNRRIKLKGNGIMTGSAAGSADVHGSIVFDGAVIGENSRVVGSIICRNTIIGKNCTIKHGSVIGENCEICDGVTLPRGSIINAGKKIGRSINNMFFSGNKGTISEGSFCGSANVLNASFCLKLGSALAKTSGSRIGVMSCGNDRSDVLKQAVLSGIREHGETAVDCCEGFASLAAFAVRDAELDMLAFIESGEGCKNSSGKDGVCITLLDNNALPPTRQSEREIAAAFTSEASPSNKIGALEVKYGAEGAKLSYCKLLLDIAGDLKGVQIKVNDIGLASDYIYSVAKECGADIEHSSLDNCLNISSDGLFLSYDNIDFWHILAIVLENELSKKDKNNRTFALPYTCPTELCSFIEENGGKTVRYLFTPNENQQHIRNLAVEQLWLRDGCMLAFKLLKIIKEKIVL